MSDKPNDERMQQSMHAATNPVPPLADITPPEEPEPAAPRHNSSASDLGNIAESIAPHDEEQVQKNITVDDAFDYDVAFNLSFLGTGQGGGRMADAFYRLGYRRVGALNTNQRDFDGISEAIHKLDLAVGGAAKDAAYAERQLQSRKEDIWDLLTRSWGDSTDYGLICAGLGGGTGSGTVTRLVEIAREYMESKGKAPRVGVIISLPTVTEGQLVARNAINTFKNLLDIKASPIIVIDNAKIGQLYRPAMSKLHAKANDTASQLLHLFNRLCESQGSVYTFDRSELAQLLDGGIVVMGAASIKQYGSPADISTAIREKLTNNVLADVDIRTGKKGCCLFVAGQQELDTLPEEYFAAGFDQLERNLGAAYGGKITPVVHRGLTQGVEGLQSYMMISELDPPVKRLAELGRKAGFAEAQLRSSLAQHLNVDDSA